MPLDPEDYDDEDEYLDDCTEQLMDDEGLDEDEAYAVCSMRWDNKSASVTGIVHKTSMKPATNDPDKLEYILSDGSVDRMGDIIDPNGWVLSNFKRNPIALFNHNSDWPVGTWKNLRIEDDALRGQLVLAAPGTSPRIDEIRALVKQKVIRAVSVGFKPLASEPIDEENKWNRRYTKQELVETSLVPIPANPNSLQTFKALGISQETINMVFRRAKRRQLAARAITLPVVKLTTGKSTMTKRTIAEQVSAFEATRSAKAARMEELLLASGEKSETLDTTGQEEYDTLEREVKSVDEHLTRLRGLERMNLAAAKQVKGDSYDEATRSRSNGDGGDGSIITVQPRVVVRAPKPVEKGIAFARYVIALARAQGNLMQAFEVAKNNAQWMAETPEIADVLKAAVAAGTTTDPAWAGPLVNYQILTSEFIELLRPATIIGRIPGLTKVPFKVKVPAQTGGASVGWVGEGAPKPVSALAFSSIVLDISKIAGIVALTEELVRLSNPSAESLVRNDLAAAIVQFMDREFVDPAKAATAVSPASITNGITGITPSGNDAAALRADISTLLASFLGANLSVGSAVWIMTQAQALRISMMQNPLGQPQFPGIGINGGTLDGVPVVASENLPPKGGVPANGYPMILALASDILLADDGTVTIDASREASLQMDSAPDNPATATTVFVSLWQANMVGIKAERYINWKRRRNNSVAWIDGAKYA